MFSWLWCNKLEFWIFASNLLRITRDMRRGYYDSLFKNYACTNNIVFFVADTLAVWSELNKRTELTASQSTKRVVTILETAERDHKETQAPERKIDDDEDCSDNGSDGGGFSDNEDEQESWSAPFLCFSIVKFVYSVSIPVWRFVVYACQWKLIF